MTDLDSSSTSQFRLLLLSGGLDSAALAAWRHPNCALFVDYGQRPKVAEARAAAAVARELGIALSTVRVDLADLGAGLLHDDKPQDGWPSPEWWPFRNQVLVTVAAAWAVKRVPAAMRNPASVVIETATVAPDGARHADGTSDFYRALDALLSLQEGSLRVLAPAIEMTSRELLAVSGVDESVIGWTHSCHRNDFPCNECPGCYKRQELLNPLGGFQ